MSTRKTEKREHPLGATRQARIDRLRAIVRFGDPADVLVQIATLALHAAQAPNDAEMQTRAAFALGLHGRKTTATNVEKLREALEDLQRQIDAAYPPPDPETGESPAAPGPGTSEARAYRALLSEGVPQWLYRHVKGRPHGDERTQLQFLERTAKADAGTQAVLEWALAIWRADRPPVVNSRGRVR